MKLLSSLVLLGFIAQINSAQADPKYWLHQRLLRRQSNLQTEIAKSNEAPKKKPLITTSYFNQVIDHFAVVKKKGVQPKFKQKYFIDATNATDKNSPVLYYFCGEGACEGANSSAPLNEISKTNHTYLIALEHRYYGTSQPFPTLEPKNLAYLSMDQAIEDLASFELDVKSKTGQTKLGLTGKWISAGGSYAGELSAFYRLKHPELVIGALASSAPVLAKADFFEYDRHIARVAPPACLAAIQSVVADVEAKLKQTDSAAAVKKLFDADMVKNDVDFLYVLADMAATAVQYGYQDTFCKTLTDGVTAGKATEAYATAGLALFKDFGITSLQDSFQGAESIKPTDYPDVGMRAWMYQSCTEFGFYQIANTDLKESSRSQQITLPYHDEVCVRLFTKDALIAAIKNQTGEVDTVKTNAKFYDKLFDSSVKNIFFTNGSNDPWSNLSITLTCADANRNQSLKLFTIDGSAHCDDIGSRDSAALKIARDDFAGYVSDWLSGK